MHPYWTWRRGRLAENSGRAAISSSASASGERGSAGRPLFSASRRPYVAPSAPLEEVEREQGRPALPLELAGTFLTDTDRTALLLVAGGSPAWLRRGQLIEGWRIEAIERDRVQLSKDGQQQVLQLRADIVVPRTTPPPARRQPGRNDAPSGAHPGEPADQNQVTQETARITSPSGQTYARHVPYVDRIVKKRL